MNGETVSQHPAAGSKFDQFKQYRFGSDEFRQYFRSEFVERFAGMEYLGLRNGYAYAAICMLPVVLIVLVLGANVSFSGSGHLLLVPLYFLICNLAEYLVHRYPMHRRLGPRNMLYAHLTIHHNFYNNEHFYFEQHRDLMASLLPWYAFLGVSLVVIAVGGGVYLLAGSNEALLFAFVAYSYYLLYEALHAAYHAPPESLVKKLPLVSRLARTHLNHHRSENMAKWNFNITFPVFDRLFGTLLPAGGWPPARK
jgi:sterol desaturase/sphingolipid hydroxylase (fatty acid hydroxylase superfamily)